VAFCSAPVRSAAGTMAFVGEAARRETPPILATSAGGVSAVRHEMEGMANAYKYFNFLYIIRLLVLPRREEEEVLPRLTN
jgi:hypothetical protein